jgi:hypothetical protein
MSDSKEQTNPGRGFRLVTNDGKEKFLPIPMPLSKPAELMRIEPGEEVPEAQPPAPLAQDAGQPPPEPPAAPPEAMEPAPEENDAAKIAKLEMEQADLLSALYWVQTQIAELKEKSDQ